MYWHNVNGATFLLTMHLSIPKVAAPVMRSFHVGVPTVRPRCFHQSTFAALPRRRNFFTSNQLYASVDSNESKTASDSIGETAQDLQQQQSKPTKRKAARSASKNLRHASMTKKTNRSKAATKKSQATEDIVDIESDYQNAITAICVAQSFDMDKAEEILRLQGFEIDPDGTDFDPDAVVHARSVNNGDLFVFNSGTVVAWSMPADTVDMIATKQLIRAAEFPHIPRKEIENLEFFTDETREPSYMKGEDVIIGTKLDEASGNKSDVTLAKIAFSSGLARSPKLAVLEVLMTDFIDKSKAASMALAGGADVKLSRRTILKQTGELCSLRAQLNHYSELADSLPDMFWDRDARLGEYYDRVGNVLDVKSRIQLLNKKIDYAHEQVTIMREMSSERHGTVLEWIIIVLIAVEVVFELRRIFIVEPREDEHWEAMEKNLSRRS